MIIDDEEKFCFGLSAILRKAGYFVMTVNNGGEGLTAIQKDSFDLILCDINMPLLNGIQLKKTLVKNSPSGQIPFIFLTARSAVADKVASFEIGADDYITKPFDVNELLSRIHAVLRRNELGYKKGVEDSSVEIDKLRSSISTNLSHEMRTPLTTLLATLDLVIKEKFTRSNIELANYIKKANQSAYRLKFLVEDLEMLHAIDTNSMNTMRWKIDFQFHIKNPIDQVLKSWENKSLNLNLTINPDTCIYAPRNEFSHTVSHLVDNACKFSPKGGIIFVNIHPNGWGGCVIEIIDQGRGIPLELREKVFERYFQISQGDCREFGGLGIGLTLARAFALSQLGELKITDYPKGCGVQMILPPSPLD